jgi:2-polyprenyl-3-methyl-5-hydroxy-6-metoxy-1,4-benzoquinol methylase
MVVCCEVLEHLDDPERALRALALLNTEYYVFSVPREPIWRVLNFMRGKYLGQLGNTPGHLQHWSATSFQKLISRYFDIDERRFPLPWTMLLCRGRERQ